MEQVKLKKRLANNILIIGFLIFTNTIFSQNKLNGTFSYLKVPQHHYESYKFNDNGTFEYRKGASVGNDYFGNGNFNITSNHLILNYNSTKPKANGKHESLYWYNDKDSIHVNVNIKDINNNPINGVNVINLKIKDGVIANGKGLATLKLPKAKFKYKISISHPNYVPYDFCIDGMYNYKTDINLMSIKENTGAPILNQVDTLKLKQIKEDYFIVFLDDGIEQKWRKIKN